MPILFLFLNENVCCGYSLEAPHRGTSNEYPQHMYSSRNKKNIMWIPHLICSYVRWCKGGRLNGSLVITHHISVSQTCLGNLGGAPLSSAEASLVRFYRIIYGYVAVPLPTYVIHQTRISRTSYLLAYIQLPDD